MRLGVLGPATGDVRALATAAQQLMDQSAADKVIYLSHDDALDRVVAGWAEEVVGANPSEAVLFDRAAATCVNADAAAIRAFVDSERARQRLKIFSSLPPDAGRTIELMDGRIVLFLFDKAHLDEEDIIGASILVYGRSDAALIKRVGVRTFVSPGPIESASGGRAILDDSGGGVRIEILNGAGEVVQRDNVGASAGTMKVQGR